MNINSLSKVFASCAILFGMSGIALTACNFFANFPNTNGCDGWDCGFGCRKLIPGIDHSGCYVSMDGTCCACNWTVGGCKPPGINCVDGWVSATKTMQQYSDCGIGEPASCEAAP